MNGIFHNEFRKELNVTYESVRILVEKSLKAIADHEKVRAREKKPDKSDVYVAHVVISPTGKSIFIAIYCFPRKRIMQENIQLGKAFEKSIPISTGQTT